MNMTWLPSFAALVWPQIIMRAVARMFPARPADPGEYDSLRQQHRVLELASQVAALFGIIGTGLLLIFVFRVGNTPWLVGAIFGWLVLTPILLIALFTLPRGLPHWRGFWRYYELTYQTSICFYGPMYVALCVLGIV